MSIIGYKLVYNGVQLDVTSGSQILREHIYSDDDTTYLYTQWTFDGIFIYNPQATSFGVDGTPKPGVMPTVSDVNIREKLRFSRGSLVYSVPKSNPDGSIGFDVLINTPAASSATSSFQTDAANGPKVERCNIIQAQGSKTFICDIRITAKVNECAPANRSPLLSHRWKRSELVDQDFMSNIVTEGEAVFRSDDLLNLTLPAGNPLKLGWPGFPDQFRRDLFHPIPNTFQRDSIEVIAQEDGVTYNYRIVDKQTFTGGPLLWPDPFKMSPRVTRIQAFHTSWYSQESPLESHKQEIWDAGLTAGGIAALAASPGGPGAMAIAGGLAGGGAMAVTAARFLPEGIPKRRHHIIARAWGDAYCHPIFLQNMVMGACLGVSNKLPGGGASRLGASTEFFITHNLTENFVQAELTIMQGFASDLFSGNLFDSLDFFNGVSIVSESFNYRDEDLGLVRNTFADGTTYQPIGGLNVSPQLQPRPIPTGDGVSRGTWVGNLLAEALSGQCQTPPVPPIKAVQIAPNGNAFGMNPSQEVVNARKLYGK